MDAALYEPAPPYSGQGRPRKKGKRLPTLAQVLQNASTVWTTVALAWYDGQVRDMQITSACAVWFHFGKQALPIRWVLLRDPQGDYDPIALLSTDPAAEVLSIVTWFVQRWQLEVTFEEARRHLGVETQRQWSDKAIARTTLLRRQPPAGLLHHSDRGSQYASHTYRKQLARHNVIVSMSRRGNCYDNAMKESFFPTLKTGCASRPFTTRAEARTAVFDYIEAFYNRQRLHSALGYRSPEQFERQFYPSS